MEPLDHNEKLKRHAPRLHALGKVNPFKVPEGFFEHFPHRVQAVAAKPRATTAMPWLKRVAIALPLVAVMAMAVHLLRLERQSAIPLDITAEEAAQLLLLSSNTTQEILSTADDADWPDLGNVTIQLSPDEAAAYVDRENIDITDLIAEP